MTTLIFRWTNPLKWLGLVHQSYSIWIKSPRQKQHLVGFHRSTLHVQIPDLEGQIISGHHVSATVTELDVWDGWDDFWEEGACAGVLGFLKHYTETHDKWVTWQQESSWEVFILINQNPHDNLSLKSSETYIWSVGHTARTPSCHTGARSPCCCRTQKCCTGAGETLKPWSPPLAPPCWPAWYQQCLSQQLKANFSYT